MASESILRGIISISRKGSGRAIQVRKGHEHREAGLGEEAAHGGGVGGKSGGQWLACTEHEDTW